MNKITSIDEALVAIIQKSMDGLDTALSFLSTEIPEVIQQLLLWKTVESFVSMILGILLILAVILGNLYIYKKSKDWDSYTILWLIWSIPGTLVSAILSGTGTTLLNITWLQILIAPKLYLIEYAAKLVGGK